MSSIRFNITLFSISFLLACEGKKPTTTLIIKDSISVKKPGTKTVFDSTKRYIYLTWDDGPQPGTISSKRIFEQEKVKATFFVIGLHINDAKKRLLIDSLKKSYPQFLVANHSHSHGFRNHYKQFYTQVDSAVADFLKVQKAINIPVPIIRLPGNNSWAVKNIQKGPKLTTEVYKRLDSLGFDVVGWDLEWQFKRGDIPIQTAEEMAEKVASYFNKNETTIPKHLVILAHDRMFAKPNYADSLRKFIQLVQKDKRNIFETIDHYPLLKSTK
ncbi:MAG: polysaccharide deacetylase family protein [Chitinophagaceae bacterium]